MISEYECRATVKELREWLEQFPEDMEVAIWGSHNSGGIAVGKGAKVEAQFTLFDKDEE